VYIGLRDVDPAEKAILKEHGIKAFSMHEVDRYGIGKVVQMALEHVNPGLDKPLHLSFDVDAMDPTVAPSEPFVPSIHGVKLMCRHRHTRTRWSDVPRGSVLSYRPQNES